MTKVVKLIAPDGWFLERAQHQHSRIVYRGDVHEPLPDPQGAWIVQFQNLRGGLLTTGRGHNLCEAWEKAVEAVNARESLLTPEQAAD